MTLTRIGLVVALFPALTCVATGAAEPTTPPLLALEWHENPSTPPNLTLVRADPVSLQGVGQRLELGNDASLFGWAFSPDHSQLALGSSLGASLRFIDLGRMRLAHELDGAAGAVEAVAWLTPARLLAESFGPSRTDLLVVDPTQQRVVRRAHLPGEVVATARAGDRIILLLSPRERIGPSRLVTADAQGRLQVRTLKHIWSGGRWLRQHRVRQVRTPALTVDPSAGRAYVIGPSGPVAEIALDQLTVTYHILQRRVLAKAIQGAQRTARWLPNGLIAVSGWNGSVSRNGVSTSEPAGLKLIDPRTWAVRTVNASTNFFLVTDSLLLTSERSAAGGDPETLIGYSFDGKETLRTTLERPLGVLEAAGRYAYNWDPTSKLMTVLDLASGSVLNQAATPYLTFIGNQDGLGA
jgi:YD repeat-containing protein